MIQRNIEKSPDLPGVQIHGEDAVTARRREQVGDELGRDRLAGPHLPILARIAEVWDDCRDPVGRSPAQRIDHHQQLHQILIHRRTGRLDDEHILAAYALLDAHPDLAVGEAEDAHLRQRDVEPCRDLLRQHRVAPAAEQLQPRTLWDFTRGRSLRFY